MCAALLLVLVGLTSGQIYWKTAGFGRIQNNFSVNPKNIDDVENERQTYAGLSIAEIVSSSAVLIGMGIVLYMHYSTKQKIYCDISIMAFVLIYLLVPYSTWYYRSV